MAVRVSTRLVLDHSAIQAVLTSPDGPVARDLIRRAQRVTEQAKVNASGRPGPNVDTGRLRSSIHWRLVTGPGGLYAEVGTTVSYARGLEFGNAPHVIRPNTKKALWWKGAKNPWAVVHHPGNRPLPFLYPALFAAHGNAVA